MNRPRVLMLLSNGFDPDPRVEAEARALAEAAAHVTVLCWDRDGGLAPAEDRGGVHVQRFRLPSTHGRGTSQALVVPRVWSTFVGAGCRAAPDVVHAHDLDTLPAAWRIARRTGAALVFDAHESYPDMLADNVARPLKAACRVLERLLVPRADLLVTVGERLRRHYQAMGARATAVVGNWRDPLPGGDAAPLRQALREGMGVTEGGVFIVFIANLTPERRLEPLLEAVEATPCAWLAVGGRGPGSVVAAEAAARCPRIRWLGPVAAADVPRWTAAADAVYYGFDPANPNARFSAPNKLFEALAAGIPVVTAKFGEIGEIVETTGCGIVVPDYTCDEIQLALRELARPERRDALGTAARAAARPNPPPPPPPELCRVYGALRRNRPWTLRVPVGEAA